MANGKRNSAKEAHSRVVIGRQVACVLSVRSFCRQEAIGDLARRSSRADAESAGRGDHVCPEPMAGAHNVRDARLFGHQQQRQRAIPQAGDDRPQILALRRPRRRDRKPRAAVEPHRRLRTARRRTPALPYRLAGQDRPTASVRVTAVPARRLETRRRSRAYPRGELNSSDVSGSTPNHPQRSAERTPSHPYVWWLYGQCNGEIAKQEIAAGNQ